VLKKGVIILALPTGFPPFIPFALLTRSFAFCLRGSRKLFLKEKVLLSFCSRSRSKWIALESQMSSGEVFPVSVSLGGL
jgi:hypothetical protein